MDDLFFMSFRLIYLLIYILIATFSYGKTVLDCLNDEQKLYTLKICKNISKLSDQAYVKIKFEDRVTEEHSINEIVQKFEIQLPEKILKSTAPTQVLTNVESTSNAIKAKNIENFKTFMYSDLDGKRLLKFECKKIILFKKKFGPFEIPYKSHIFIDPLIHFY